MDLNGHASVVSGSLPSRERGLKFDVLDAGPPAAGVAPFTGAWIEILKLLPFSVDMIVAPFTGAWIEIIGKAHMVGRDPVAPFTGAWIEMPTRRPSPASATVAPFTGAWIEICTMQQLRGREGRSLHGSVD